MTAPHLTLRELEVLVLMCHPKCWVEKEMPDLLKMSLSSFKTHKESLFFKFKLNRRMELQFEAVRCGLVPCQCRGMAGEAPEGSAPTA
ncbi:MAG: helix-turn-helix transcriptional regulator [Flavobacteriales bacterium]|nr:helix-turn-helix transcriptional regulator [Flavobacteriales bacterium]